MKQKKLRKKTFLHSGKDKFLENMKVCRVVRRSRPWTKAIKNGQCIFLSIVGFLLYSILWQKKHIIRQIETIDEGPIYDKYPNPDHPIHDAPIDEGPIYDKHAKPDHAPFHATERVHITETPQKKDTTIRQYPSSTARNKAKRPSDQGADDPFHRKGLKQDKYAMKLAESDPIESEGRVMRPKLGQSLKVVGNEPIILIWKAMEYQMKHYKEHLEFLTPPECGSCRVTTNRAFIRECSALVQFNSPDLRKFLDLPDPKTRNPNQVYVFWSKETPVKTYHFADIIKNPRFDKIFNLTMNYRLDSDIVDYFGNKEYELRFFAEKQKYNGWFDKMMARKNGLVIWAVSNCNKTLGAVERMNYAMRLINSGLDVSTYGTCFNNRYKGGDLVKALQRHKFYFSFENSIHCPDYISEKFWRNGLRSGAVPIVWGPTKEDVAKIAPPHSFIHVEDFKSPREVVNYVNYLNNNDTAYREYHKWRFQPIDESIPYEEVIPTHRSTFCRLCKKITDKNFVPKTVPSVHKWLYETGYVDDKCLRS